jgi:methylenetetrahydrofolate dehydrogenase (NADP+)/methenyltetrahydrofolate cyclohydrolase
MVNVICGKTLALKRRELLANKVSDFKQLSGRSPCLSVILVGEYPPSLVYVGAKQKACNDVGIASKLIKLPVQSFEQDLFNIIDDLNSDTGVDGILLQLPLPGSIDPFSYLSKISPLKDVDGLSPYNLGRLLAMRPIHIPCTPQGVMEILSDMAVNIESKKVVILGRSILVGRSLALLMEQANATVTVVHSKTQDPELICKQADILVSAIGKPGYITDKFVKPGAIVIDVGITNVHGSLKGDVDFDSVEKVASHLTPVPGGVGPMTVSKLLENTINAAYFLHSS